MDFMELAKDRYSVRKFSMQEGIHAGEQDNMVQYL